MKFFKNTAVFVFITGALVYSGYSFYLYSLGPCDRPLEYSIGRFDTQFGVSKEEFKSQIVEAGMVWEKALGKTAFLYNPDASFKINLIYDERQIITVEKQKTEFGLNAVEDVFKKLDTEFNSVKTAYEGNLASHKKAVTSFEARQSQYESSVKYWNSRGGAPKNQYEALQNEALYLSTEGKRLNAEAAAISTATKELNTLLAERNKAAQQYNLTAQNYNKKYGNGLEFNQAEYTGNAINVYQFGNKKDLAIALTHELGHALGMNHVENPESIMYYITGTNASTTPVPSVDDLAELKKVCGIK